MLMAEGIVDTQAFVEALMTMPREQAVAVLGELLRNRPTLAPSIVGFACPDLTYAPARGMTEKRAMGTLKSFSAKTGFGFIACPELHEVFGADVFVHIKQMGPFASVLTPGTAVTFAVVIGKENKPQAYDVQPMDGVLAESIIQSVGETMQDMSMGPMAPMGPMAFAAPGLAAGPFVPPYGDFQGVPPGGIPQPGPPSGTGGAKRKWDDPSAELGRYRGVVKSFNGTKGFGFIICEELQQQGFPQDVFLGQAQAPPTCQAGANVNFTAFLNERSQPQAKNVEII